MLIVLCFLQLHISAQTNNKPIHVLIIDGYSNHDWKQTTNITKSILEESKLFKVDVSTAPANPLMMILLPHGIRIHHNGQLKTFMLHLLVACQCRSIIRDC